jgi:hypothetical protein
MKNTLSIFGTGVVPFSIGSSATDRHRYQTMSAVCPYCGLVKQDFSQLSRDYLSVLYAPLLPLGLASCMNHCADFRVRISRDTASSIRDFLNTGSSFLHLGAWGTWRKAFFYAVIGCLIGYFLFSSLFFHSKAVFLPVVAILAAIVGFVEFIKKGICFCIPFDRERFKGYPLTFFSNLSVLAHCWSPVLAFVALMIVTARFGPIYPYYAGAFWGTYCMNLLFLTRSELG